MLIRHIISEPGNQKMEAKAAVLADRVERRIFLLRGQKVMLGSDLAHLCNVEPRALALK